MMEEKDKERLIELVMTGGEVRNDTFQYSSGLKQGFAERYGMKELFEKHDELVDDIHWAEDPIAERRYQQQLQSIRQMIAETAKRILTEEGLDMESAMGQSMNEEEKRKSILSQLADLGIDEKTAIRLGLDNAEILEKDNKELRMSVPDTPERREMFDKEGYDYEPKDGRLSFTLTAIARQGVSVADSMEARRYLRENEIEYMPLTESAMRSIAHAQNRSYKSGARLFIPFSWGPACNRSVNNGARRLIGNMARITALCAVLTPIGALVVMVAANKLMDWEGQGLLKVKRNGPSLSPNEKKALRDGETVFLTDKYGRCMYVYSYKGNTYTMDPRDLRIPHKIDGVSLTATEFNRLRRGELVALRDGRGGQFAIRIDATSPDGVKRFSMERELDMTVTKIPTRKSKDSEKLLYISQKGMEGIDMIFGVKDNDTSRDLFLANHGLSQVYRMGQEVRAGQDKEKTARIDARIRDVAALEYSKENIRRKGLKI